ncbi:hypothetical protein HK099_003771 [Clydaea vesicula]|uniref:Uncharacterized protein n=1 Tax=Clydaea vesicula TaxID=447962 RepID=A0AAD5Y0Q7_9FUNG|nr:hypothetical protein HK099_003771 [Clydaea vesicula]
MLVSWFFSALRDLTQNSAFTIETIVGMGFSVFAIFVEAVLQLKMIKSFFDCKSNLKKAKFKLIFLFSTMILVDFLALILNLSADFLPVLLVVDLLWSSVLPIHVCLTFRILLLVKDSLSKKKVQKFIQTSEVVTELSSIRMDTNLPIELSVSKNEEMSDI